MRPMPPRPASTVTVKANHLYHIRYIARHAKSKMHMLDNEVPNVIYMCASAIIEVLKPN